ncbi:MAG: fatty acid desaturase [Hyphomicrobium sp.]
MTMETETPDRNEIQPRLKSLAQRCAAFNKADSRRAVFQLVTTLVPLFLLVASMFALMRSTAWLALILALPAGGLIVRLFVIQHDCGHGSFFPSRAANDLCGRCLSIFTLTPYGLWRREHAQHHASSGNLDRRGIGDITTLTVKEYQALPPVQRLSYRIYRNPVFLFGLGIPLYFLVLQRLPWLHGLPASEAWKSVLALDLAMAVIYGFIGYAFGFTELALAAIPIIAIAAAAGGWLFYIQHQFDDAYWEHSANWEFQSAAVLGSSFYALPAILNWFTGHIGLHHIHHLNSKIPNYRLRECLDAIPEFKSLNHLTLAESFRCARLKLWDEESHRLVSFTQAG